MAIIHRADLRPSKLELVGGWVPTRPWGGAAAGTELEQVAAYRFDDPAGEVGVETFVVRAGDLLLHVPLTYRGAPVPEQEAYLIGTTEHSVLGRRWFYDACGDPVYVAALAGAVLTGSPQAEEFVVVDDGRQRREPTARVVGSPARPVPATRRRPRRARRDRRPGRRGRTSTSGGSCRRGSTTPEWSPRR